MTERFSHLSNVLRRGANVRCRDCGKTEFFEGGVLHSILAAKNSPNWYIDDRDFAVCKQCYDKRKAGEVS